MKKIIVLMTLVMAGSAFQCESSSTSISDESAYCSNIKWLVDIIEDAKQNASKAEVIRYKYNGETVYYINTCKDCADSMAQVHNCSGEVICQFGGVAGFNTCPDFESTATAKKVVWSN